MKAISLWQPWASLMAVGAKFNETRSWPTSYRGPLAICSAKCPGEIGDIQAYWLWFHRGALGPSCGNVRELFNELPRGFVLCVVDLDDCVPTQAFHGATPMKCGHMESELGDYSLGRFAWMTRNLRRLKEPVPVVGRQGLWNLPPETVKLIEQQL